MKTRLALAKSGQFRGIWDCFSKVVRSEKMAGLYRGLTPSLVGIIPYAGIDLAVYEVCFYGDDGCYDDNCCYDELARVLE